MIILEELLGKRESIFNVEGKKPSEIAAIAVYKARYQVLAQEKLLYHPETNEQMEIWPKELRLITRVPSDKMDNLIEEQRSLEQKALNSMFYSEEELKEDSSSFDEVCVDEANKLMEEEEAKKAKKARN